MEDHVKVPGIERLVKQLPLYIVSMRFSQWPEKAFTELGLSYNFTILCQPK